MEAGAEIPNQNRVPVPAGMSEAWHVFLPSWYKFADLYEFRGTMFLECRS